MIIAVIFHSIQIADNSLVGLICNPIKGKVINNILLFFSLHIKCHKTRTRGILYRILLHLLKMETYLRVSIQKRDFTFYNFDEAHLETYLPDSQG